MKPDAELAACVLDAKGRTSPVCRTGIHLAVFVMAISLFGCRAQVKAPQVHVGMSKAEVIAALGQPDGKQTLVKNTEHVWGPVEAVWYELEMGERIEIWSYNQYNLTKGVWL